jgi:hypothetical protein
VLSDGPCFQPGSHYVATAPAHVGQPFLLEAFPPAGARLEACAALVVGGQRFTPWHGVGGAPIIAGGPALGEVAIRLARTVPVRVPAALAIE